MSETHEVNQLECTQTLYIIVYRGSPIDSFSTRHTAFFITFSNDLKILCHATGAHGFFQYEEKWDTYNPEHSVSRAGTIPVFTHQSTSPMDLCIRNVICETPLNNQERAWNCQTWIGDGLKRLQDAGYLSEQNANTAADQMVEILLEAPDEDIM